MRWRFWNISRSKWNILSLTSLTIVCLCALFACQHYLNYEAEKISDPHSLDVVSFEQARGEKIMDSEEINNDDDDAEGIFVKALENATQLIEKTLGNQRETLRMELKNSTGLLYGNDERWRRRNILHLIPESGGEPLRSVIVTTWRSGSTFLGEILNAIPGNFYHYEPLLDYEIVQIRGPPLAQPATDRLRKLFKCDYSDMESYLEYGREHNFLFTHNTRLWGKCQGPNAFLCWIPEFLTPFCRLFPFQSAKIVRLRLKLMEQLLDDASLNLKVLYLVRDPRGALQSRRHRDWCPNHMDCFDSTRLCADLISDYSSSLRFFQKYPNTFRVLRYEDLATNVYEEVGKMLNFFGFEMQRSIVNFLDTHTKVDAGGVSSTYRDSRRAPFHWTRDLTFQQVAGIQRSCKFALKLWGYVEARNESHLKTFRPLFNKKFGAEDTVDMDSK